MAHPWPFKCADLARSSVSVDVGFVDLSKPPTWVFTEPTTWRESEKLLGFISCRCFHASPIVDSEKNIYIPSTPGKIFALSKEGTLLWTYCTDTNPGNLALLDGFLYGASDKGFAYALVAATGEEKWKSKIGAACPSDTFSAIAWNGVVLLPATDEDWHPEVTKDTPLMQVMRTKWKDRKCGNELVVAVNIEDGSIRWKFNMAAAAGTISYNIAPCIVEGTVFFHDIIGGMYRLSMDGEQLWHEAGLNPNSWTTGGVCIAPNGVAFCGFCDEICNRGTGKVRAHDITSGRVLWTQTFEQGVNAAPAVGNVGIGDVGEGSAQTLAVVVAVGNNPDLPEFFWESAKRFLTCSNPYKLQGRISVLNSTNGDVLWTFTTPDLQSKACAGSKWVDLSLPDQWGAPAIGMDGTVYANWSGGRSYAIRKKGSSQRVDPEDPNEVVYWEHGFGSNSCSAFAPGMVVVACAKKLGVWIQEGLADQ